MDKRLRRRLVAKRRRIYKAFIKDRRSKQPALKSSFEWHHIHPLCLGGTDAKSNMIKLKHDDHLFAHYLLAHIYGGPMWCALWRMLKHPSMRRGRAVRSSNSFSTHRWYSLAKEKTNDWWFTEAKRRHEVLCSERERVLKKIGMPARRPIGNPRRPGTPGHRSMGVVLNSPGITLAAFRKAGGRTGDLYLDILKGHVRVDADNRLWPSVQ